MRPIRAFVDVANRFPGAVTVMRAGGAPAVNGKSMLQLMTLGAEQGTELLIEVTGPDALATLQALLDVFQCNFDED